MSNFLHQQREWNRKIALCNAILAGSDVSQPITRAAVQEGVRIGQCIVLAAQVHPRAGEAVRRSAGYRWHV